MSKPPWPDRVRRVPSYALHVSYTSCETILVARLSRVLTSSLGKSCCPLKMLPPVLLAWSTVSILTIW